MSTPEAQQVHPFTIWTVDEAGTKKGYVGGSYDNASAVTIACGVYDALQDYSVATWRQVRVYDSTDQVIAFIGAEQTLPPPVLPPPPTLASLDPDSSGDWEAEVRLLGTGFTDTSEILADDALVTPVTFVDATELRCVVPVTAAGPYQVKVRNGTQESNPLQFTAL